MREPASGPAIGGWRQQVVASCVSNVTPHRSVQGGSAVWGSLPFGTVRGPSPASRAALIRNVRKTEMPKVSSLLMVAVLSAAGFRAEAAPLHKCVVNGTVTYQQAPCASTQPRKEPTLEELNAAEKKKRAAAASAATGTGTRTPGAPATAATSGRFSCDGRQYCSQMRSCEEAKYFLANCPDPKMDGDRDGIPCEEQWCSFR